MDDTVQFETTTLKAGDGGRFNLTRVSAGSPVHAPLVFLPGMFTGRRFWLSDKCVGLAAYLAQAGFPGYIVERRGVGDSPGGDARPGLNEHICHDLPMVQQRVAQEHAQSAFWLGHSFGGLMASRATAEYLNATQVAGLVLFATQFEVGKAPLVFPGSVLTRLLVRVLGHLPARSTGLGPEDEPAAAVIDATRWVGSRWRGHSLQHAIEQITCPVLALSGAADRVDPASGCKRFIGHFASSDKRFVLAGKNTGFPENFNHPGVVISKRAQTTIWPLVKNWLIARQRTTP